MNADKSRRAGTTLVELIVAMALLGTLTASLIAAWNASVRLFQTGVTRATLEADARRAVDRFSRELRGARSASLEALPESPVWQATLDFDRVRAIRAGDGRVTWSSNRAEFRLDAEETDDGLDNDGDELVDEGEFVLVQDVSGADELPIVLAHGVREHLEGELPNGVDDNDNGLIDERGVAFERVGDDLRVYLTLEARDRERRLVTRTIQTTIWSRN